MHIPTNKIYSFKDQLNGLFFYKKMKKVIVSFLIIITLFCNLSVNVYASDFEDSTAELTPYEYYQLKTNNFLLYLMESAGVILNPAKYGEGLLKDRFVEYMADKHLIENVDSMEDYINSHMNITGETIQVDDELMDAVYNFSLEIIEEETPWYLSETVRYSEISAKDFKTQTEYESLQNYFKTLPADSVVYIGIAYCTATGQGEDGSGAFTRFYEFSNDDLFVYYSGGVDNLMTYASYGEILAYDSDWNLIQDYHSIYNLSSHNVTTSTHYSVNNHKTTVWGAKSSNYGRCGLFTSNGRKVRVYKTIEDMKEYSVGNRPYYITDKFQDYDINGDNSCIVTESDLSNGSVYGDVYNYIINNYDNPDGLTEDELRDILNDYFGQGSGGSGSGSGSGNGSGSSGGSGLGNFLEGLGSLGDGILSILGKLLEYVGKAIDLLSGTVTKVLDLVPKNITNLLTGLFPFIPQEWKTAIELSLVLAVIGGIVGLLKK